MEWYPYLEDSFSFNNKGIILTEEYRSYDTYNEIMCGQVKYKYEYNEFDSLSIKDKYYDSNCENSFRLYDRAYYKYGQSYSSINPTYNNQVNIYPVPSSDFVNIDIDALIVSASYVIIDINGRVVSSGVLKTVHSEIALSMLNKGTFFLNISFENSIITRKFTVL
jgi:hypothetical protein